MEATMGTIPTMTVKNKKGHLMRINVADFDAKEHESIGDVTEAPPPKVFAEDIEAKIAAAKTKATLAAIATQYGLDISEEQLKGKLVEIRSVLLPQVVKR
jgi:hypothetical protein